jgi:hypothetical protein
MMSRLEIIIEAAKKSENCGIVLEITEQLQ